MDTQKTEKANNIIGYDFQGWAIKKMTVREIIKELGFILENSEWKISDENSVLDIYPTTLEDDGMGYGINEQFITEVDKFTHNDTEYIHMFISKNILKNTIKENK